MGLATVDRVLFGHERVLQEAPSALGGPIVVGLGPGDRGGGL